MSGIKEATIYHCRMDGCPSTLFVARNKRVIDIVTQEKWKPYYRMIDGRMIRDGFHCELHVAEAK